MKAYVYGSAEDYNRWAELVGDGGWSWKHTKEGFKKVYIFPRLPQLGLKSVCNQIEAYDTTASAAYSKYVNPKAEDHGHNG